MLLQDFFASARSHRAHKEVLLQKSAVHYSSYLKLNNITAQRKATNIEKQDHP